MPLSMHPDPSGRSAVPWLEPALPLSLHQLIAASVSLSLSVNARNSKKGLRGRLVHPCAQPPTRESIPLRKSDCSSSGSSIMKNFHVCPLAACRRRCGIVLREAVRVVLMSWWWWGLQASHPGISSLWRHCQEGPALEAGVVVVVEGNGKHFFCAWPQLHSPSLQNQNTVSIKFPKRNSLNQHSRS